MSTFTRRPFVLTGADGAPLRGDVRTAGSGEGRPAVIICHGFKGFKDWGFFPVLAERLATAGLTAVSFNFSGSGVGPDGENFSEPERFGHGTLSADLEDLGTVCGALAEGSLIDGLAKVKAYGLFGHSRGGGTAILRAADDPALRALVTWAAVARPIRWDSTTIARWRAEGRMEVVNARTGQVLPLYLDMLEDLERRGDALDITAAAGRVRGPWLIVHGAEDEAVGVQEAHALHSASQCEVELSVVEGGGHTFGARHPWGGYTNELAMVMEQTVSWYCRYLF